MFEKSTSDARPISEHRCLAGRTCRDAQTIDGQRHGAHTTDPDTLCDPCRGSVQWAIDDLTHIWIALHMAIGDANRRVGQKVGGSRTAPINLNTDVDATKTAVVEWLVAAAARLAEPLNIDDPKPRNNTDTEHARIVVACTRIISPHLEQLLALDADDINVWLNSSETEYPGERFYIDDQGKTHKGVASIPMTGVDIALKLTHLHRTARSLLAITTPRDKMSLPCPYCNEYELVRTHRGTINLVSGKTKDIDQIDCGTCGLSWPYERYQHLCEMWVKEDEMEREKLQKQLDTERERRELAEWLLAQREWQFSLALECTDMPANVFAQTVLIETEPPMIDDYLSDKDVATLVGVSDGTVRSWASRGHITRHTANDGATLFHAREVWNYAKTNRSRTTTTRRLDNHRKATA